MLDRARSRSGDGLSHAAFGGITLGTFLGLSSPLTIAIAFTALAARGGLVIFAWTRIAYATFAEELARLALRGPRAGRCARVKDAAHIEAAQVRVLAGRSAPRGPGPPGHTAC